MSLLDYFRLRQKETASVAKERLQIIISHERTKRQDPSYLARLQEELVKVIAKYIEIDSDQVNVQIDREGENAILELNVTLPEHAIEEERAS